MKKIIALFLMMTAVFCVFAVDTSVYLDTPTDKVNIGFAKDNDKALAGTSASSDFHLGSIPLTADLKFAETTYSNKVFIFYRGVVGSVTTYKLSFSIDGPFTFDGSSIHYRATVKKPKDIDFKWDGTNSSTIENAGITIDSAADSKTAELESNIHGSSTNFVVSGVAQVEINISETDISLLKYGSYKTKMTLTLTTK